MPCSTKTTSTYRKRTSALRRFRCRALLSGVTAKPLTTWARHYLSSFLASGFRAHISAARTSSDRRRCECHREHESDLLLYEEDGADALRKTRLRCGPKWHLHDIAARGPATKNNLLRTVRRPGRHRAQATRQLLPMQPSTPFNSVLPVATQSSMPALIGFKHAESEANINRHTAIDVTPRLSWKSLPVVTPHPHPEATTE